MAADGLPTTTHDGFDLAEALKLVTYGLILTMATVIAIPEEEADADSLTAVIAAAAATGYLAHVFAGFAAHSVKGIEGSSRNTLGAQFREESPYLVPSVGVALVMSLAHFDVVPFEAAVLICLAAATAVLIGIGITLARRAGRGSRGQILGGTSFAGLGAMLVLLNALTH